ncbi:AMP-binding protein [Variovorax paradoxus]|nr:AMP-binding protein [Variovorax paradoxus]MBT2301934.1 AMP-binding protein [Variovorax paradoxus]
MTSNSYDPAGHAAKMRGNNWWPDVTTDELIAQATRRFPDKEALVAYRADAGETAVKRLSFSQLEDLVSRGAAALHAMGVGPGDVVSVQVPNHWEFVVASLAVGRLGAVVNPLMPIFREREMSYMLGFCEAKVLIVPKSFRGFDYEEMAKALRPQCPGLQHVLVVGGDGENGFERALFSGSGRIAPAPDAASAPSRADEMAVMMFTSGTTGEPKGVMHSCNSLVACVRGLAKRFGLSENDVLLACSPLGHMTGYAAVMFQGLCLGCTVVLQDVWDGKRGVAIMAAEGVTHTATSTPFLVDICEAVAAGGPRPELRTYLCGGAPIPPVVVERAARELNLNVSSLWGMTESLGGTLTEPGRAHEKSASTDGRPLEGTEVKVTDLDGEPLPPGETGRLMVRGAQMFMGYYKREDLEPFDAEGWFDTGDLAYMDAEGYIRINGRTKDVLIRGGENVPVMEVENLLLKHPAVSGAALVGMPDLRLGERGCAFVTLRPGQCLDLAGLQAYMNECKVAKQYWPERLEVVAELPKTPSGKIQKFVLREKAKAFSQAA